jgi:acetyltransferase-like isoleucine patch superfamily enzyme
MSYLLDWICRSIALLFVLWLCWYGFGYVIMALYFRQLKKRGRVSYVQAESKPSIEGLETSFHFVDLVKSLLSGWARYSLLFTGRIPSHAVRNFIYRNVYQLQLHKRAVLYGGSEIRSPQFIEIQEGAIVGDSSILDGRNGISIGRHVNLSSGVWIWTLQHDLQSPDFAYDHRSAAGQVTIGDRAWISCRVTILPGVTIGEGAVVAAGSVVTKDVEPYSINAGIPSKKIGDRNNNLKYEFDGSHFPFF